MTTIRGLLYALARLMGDVNAVKKGTVGKRIGRRVVGRATGRTIRRAALGEEARPPRTSSSGWPSPTGQSWVQPGDKATTLARLSPARDGKTH